MGAHLGWAATRFKLSVPLELIYSLQQRPELWGPTTVTVLPLGNHEQHLLDSLGETAPGKVTDVWIWNSGDFDLLDFVAENREWFEGLPVRLLTTTTCLSMMVYGQECLSDRKPSRI